MKRKEEVRPTYQILTESMVNIKLLQNKIRQDYKSNAGKKTDRTRTIGTVIN